MFEYDVTMQRADGEMVNSRYKVRWNPEKITAGEVAASCAAEATVASGRMNTSNGLQYAMPHAGITAALLS